MFQEDRLASNKNSFSDPIVEVGVLAIEAHVVHVLPANDQFQVVSWHMCAGNPQTGSGFIIALADEGNCEFFLE